MSVATGPATRDLPRRVRALFQPVDRERTARNRHAGMGRIGAELELLPVRRGPGPPSPVRPGEIIAALDSDPCLLDDGRISFEPGGQLELSPPPSATPVALLRTLERLLCRLRRCCDPCGITLIHAALSPWHDAATIGLQVPQPRYRAMQRHFDAIGPDGRRMMRQTAALQICLDLDPGNHRWELLNQAGPAIAATFAASPLLDGAPSGERSTRLTVWQQVDPSRTGFDGRQVTGAPEDAYCRFALEAEAIPLLRSDGADLPFRVPLREWLERGEARPDGADLDHHLTTLFPPVRPRGYLEVRYLDNLPPRWLAVAVCLLAALTAEPAVCREVVAALDPDVRPSPVTWRRAALLGTADPALRRASLTLFGAALEALPRLPDGHLPQDAESALTEYRECFPAAGRCPADVLLERRRTAPDDPAVWI